jgi:hypothetical protein
MRTGSMILLLGLLFFSCDLYDQPFLEVDIAAGFYNGPGGERVTATYDYTPGMNQFIVLNLHRVNGTSDQFIETFMLTPGVDVPLEMDSVGNELGTGEYFLRAFMVFGRGGRVSYNEGQSGTEYYFVVHNSVISPPAATFDELLVDLYSDYATLGFHDGHWRGYLRFHHPLDGGSFWSGGYRFTSTTMHYAWNTGAAMTDPTLEDGILDYSWDDRDDFLNILPVSISGATGSAAPSLSTLENYLVPDGSVAGTPTSGFDRTFFINGCTNVYQATLVYVDTGSDKVVGEARRLSFPTTQLEVYFDYMPPEHCI